ncbi:MAG: ABC transporter substrate-binding protein [Betaproteobacteria bacterium]
MAAMRVRALLLLLPLCAFQAHAAEILLGAAVSLTTDFALTGIQQKNGIDMAVEEANAKGGINGVKIRVEYADNALSPTVAVNALNKLLSSGPAAVFLTVRGAQVLPQIPLLDKAKVPGLTVAGARNLTRQGSQYLFRFFPHDGMAKRAVALYAVEKLNRRKLAIIHVADEYGTTGRDTIIATLKEKGLAPVAIESNQATDKDMSAQLLKVKGAGADVLVLQNHQVPCAILLRQARQLGLNIPLIGSSSCTLPQTIDLAAKEDVEGLYGETLSFVKGNPDPAIQAWAKKMQDRFRVEPDVFALLQYDAANTLFAAMRRAGTTAEAIRRGMNEIVHEGLLATYSADAQGNMTRQILILQVRDKRLHPVERLNFTKEESEKL